MKPPLPNSYWLEPGRILCGEYPRDLDDLGDHEGMSAILRAGARTFVDLTEEGELKPYREILTRSSEALGIAGDEVEWCRFPIRDVSVPASVEAMDEIVDTVIEFRERGKAIYLHYWGGRGRTGTVAGCLLQQIHELDGEAALEELTRLWQACAKSSYSESPETEEQRNFVRNWRKGRVR